MARAERATGIWGVGPQEEGHTMAKNGKAGTQEEGHTIA
jgi:hypothetical protein